MKKEEFSKDWFDEDQLIWLRGSYVGFLKRDIKSYLDELGIKWTIKESDDVTKVIDDGYNRSHNRKYIRCKSFYQMYKRWKGEELGDHSDKILDLLKSDNKESIALACVLIGDKLIENEWIPWLRLNKHIPDCKALLVKNKCGLGRTDWVERDFKKGIDLMLRNLAVPEGQEEQHIIEFYRLWFNR